MRSSPAPSAFAGAGPTNATTGTLSVATRFARATASVPSEPEVFSWRTTIAFSRSA
jgi:hypothetical protein